MPGTSGFRENRSSDPRMRFKSTLRFVLFCDEPFERLRISGFALELLAIFLLAVATYDSDGLEVKKHWVGSWAASQQLVEPANSLSPANIRDATIRQIVHLSLGGREIRLWLSNRFGTTDLHLTSVHVARAVAPDSGKITPGSDAALTFSASQAVTIPPGADYVSDPISFPVAPLSDLAITFHTQGPPDEQTGHPGSRATSYFVHGDLVSAIDLSTEGSAAKTIEHWYYIAGVDVAAPTNAAAVVVLGDSITDGHGVTTNGNDRWTDVLASRMAKSKRGLAVLNEGIGGNHLLTDGLGPNALSRFDHDVIAQPGVRYLIVLEGINDIGLLARKGDASGAEHETLIRRLIGAYEQFVTLAHGHGIKVIGATLMPFVGSSYYHPGPANEADRQAVNKWIRTPGHFDAIIDFDKITRDPEHPERLLAGFDSGDHLHPSVAGYAAMGDAVPLSLFAPSAPTPDLIRTGR